MSTAEYDYPPGPLTRFRRGAIAGVAAWLWAVLVVALACIVAWFPNPENGVPISSAVRAAVVATAAGNFGGVSVGAVHLSVSPMIVTVLLVVMLRHAFGHADGRAGAVGVVGAYAVACAVGGAIGLGTTSTPAITTLVGAALVASAVGAWTLGRQVARERLGQRWASVVRAAVVASLVYLAAGASLVALELAVHLRTAVELQKDLALGAAGLPIVLLALAVVPNMAIAAASVLAGGTVSFGGHSSVSLWSVEHGHLPDFPLLAAVPVRAMSLPVAVTILLAVALLAGRLAWRALPDDETWTGTSLNIVAMAGGAGVIAGVSTWLAEGALGGRSMAHVGGLWWQTALLVPCVVGAATGIWPLLGVARGSFGLTGPDAQFGHEREQTADDELVSARK